MATEAGRWSSGEYHKKGIARCPSNVDDGTAMLDRRDIQTLMYCVRLTETSGQWQSGYPVRTPNDLECKLAELLAQVGRREAARAARSRATAAA